MRHQRVVVSQYGGPGALQLIFVPVPDGLDPAETVGCVLNGMTAYQMLHHCAKARSGQSILIHGASGGVGTTLLQQGRLLGVTMYGTCSSRGAPALTQLGGTPVDYRRADLAQEVLRLSGGGVDRDNTPRLDPFHASPSASHRGTPTGSNVRPRTTPAMRALIVLAPMCPLPSERTRPAQGAHMATTTSWFYWAAASACFAALTAIFAKIGIQGVDSDLATLVRTVIIVFVLAGFVLYAGKWSNPFALPRRTWLFLALSALATGASWVCYFRALQLGDASQVAPVDKFSVVLVAVFAFAFLGERPLPREWLGIGLVATGVLVLSFKR
jgi:bacterial/archaeal transporter family protein